MKKNLLAHMSHKFSEALRSAACPPDSEMLAAKTDCPEREQAACVKQTAASQNLQDKQTPTINLNTKLKKIWQDPVYFLAFGFGTGLMKPAPGTWGTLAGVLVYLLMAHCSPIVYTLLTIIAFIAGVFWCDKVSRELGVHDYSGIVWDEVVGYLLTMIGAPLSATWMIIGFLLFRVFDIWKPQPIGWIDQRVKGGMGIMLDDVIAAIPAWFILRILIWTFE